MPLLAFRTKKERDRSIRIKQVRGDASPQARIQAYRERFDEYAARLPRITMSRCPICGAMIKRAFDPFGLDGPWWSIEPTVHYEEPLPCEHFKVLLGALSLHGRIPVESVDEVQPGPEVPFVIPALLRMPGMLAVVSRISMETGDVGYPIAYFSDQAIRPLHQFWCRKVLWFDNGVGGQSWAVANHRFDFDLVPYVTSKQLRWCDPDHPEAEVRTIDDAPCPFIDLPGDRERQYIAFGERHLMGLPNDEQINPFAD